MQIVIDISEDDYRKVQDGRASVSMMRKTIRNGTPLPKGLQGIYDRGYNDGEFDGYHSTLIEQGVEKSHYREVEADKTESEG